MSESTESMLRLLRMLPEAAQGEMVGMYRRTLSQQVEAVSLALAGVPGEEATRTVHQLAGSAAMMQDPALSSQARAVEKALRDGRGEEARARWPGVEACASQTLAALGEAYPAG